MDYKRLLKRVGVFGLSSMMVVGMVSETTLITLANEINPVSDADISGYSSLSGVSIDTKKDNIVTLKYEGGEKAKITFLRDNMFRFNVEPTGEFQEVPTPNSEDHKATIVAQLDDDTSAYTHPTPTIADENGTITISTDKVALVINKADATMKLVDKTANKTVWEEAESIKYKNKETIQTLKTDENENIFGGGVQHGRFTHKGTTLNIASGGWNDGGSSSPTPFFWSTNGYGIIRNTWKPGEYDFGETYSDKIVTSHDETRFDSYFFVDDQPTELINDYEDITGHAQQLPEYAFYLGTLNCYNRDYWDTERHSAEETAEREATHGSGNRYMYGDDTEYYERIPAKLKTTGEYILEPLAGSEIQETLLNTDKNDKFTAQNVIDMHEEADIPMAWFLPNDGYGCGYGQTDSFEGDLANLKSFTDYANDHGVQTGLWTQANLWPVGETPVKGDRDVAKEVSEAGIRSIKTDVAWVWEGYSMALNGISVAHDAISKSGDRPNIVTLMGWAGTQRYGGIWTGDQNGGTWEYIRFHIPTYIGAGLSGQPNMSSDMDGIYAGGDPVITTRDYQWKAFTPQMLDMDGWGSKMKFPYIDGDPYTSINRSYLKLKAQLMPYINKISYEASTTSNPMIRATFLEYPNEGSIVYDKTTQYQYLWGDSFLVAPIYQNTNSDEDGNDVRNGIYLPGEDEVWIDYFTGEQYRGGQLINDYDAPVWKLPLFVKNGAIIPMYSENNNPYEITDTNTKGLDKTERIVEFYPSGSTNFTTYEDDGMSNDNTEKHITSEITSIVDETAKTATLSIGKTSGTYDGFDSLKNRSTEFVVNVSQEPTSITGSVAGTDVTFNKVADKEAYDAATGNVWYYDENPESFVNTYADEGTSFDVTSAPKVYVKSTEKTDITANAFTVVVNGFVNDGKLPANEENKALTAPTFTEPEIDYSSIRLNWNAVEGATTYDVEDDGVVYTMNKNTTYLHKNLESDTEHTYRVRSANAEGYSEWSKPVTYRTLLDPLRNVAKDMSIKWLGAGSVPAGYGGTVFESLVDGSDKTEYSSGPATWKDQSFSIDMNKIYSIEKLEYLFRENGGNGATKQFGLAYSLDGANWIPMDDWNINFADCPKDETGTYRTATLELAKTIEARYLKFTVKNSTGNFFQGYEIRPYHVDGEQGRVLGDMDGNNVIDVNDELALRQHFALPGKHTGDSNWDKVTQFKTDYNENGIFDAYDASTLLTQLGETPVTSPVYDVDGNLFIRPEKEEVKAGETVSLDVLGAGLESVNAFDLELTFAKGAVSNVTMSPTDASATMTPYSLFMDRSDSTTFYGTLINTGTKNSVNGNAKLATITFTANTDMNLSDLNITHSMLVSSGLFTKDANVVVLNSAEKNPEMTSVTSMVDLTNENYKTTFEDANGADAAEQGHEASKLFDGNISDGGSLDTSYNGSKVGPYTLKVEFANPEDNSKFDQKSLSDIVLYTRITNGDGVAAGGLLEGEVLSPEGNYAGTPYSPDRLASATVKLHTLSKTVDCGTYSFNDTDKVQKIHLSEKCQLDGVIRVELTDMVSVGGKADRLNIAEMQVYENDKTKIATAITPDENNPTEIEAGKTADFKATVTPETAVNKFMTVTSSDTDTLKVVRKVVDGVVAYELQADKNVVADTKVTLTMETLEGVKATSTITVKPSAIPNKDDLKALYEANKDLKEEAYTAESWAAFSEALAAAKAMIDNEAATQLEINTAVTVLKEAINGLVEVVQVNKDALQTLYDANSNKEQGIYTAESWKVFTDALTNAKTVLDDENATQEAVDNAVLTLSNAIEDLVEEGTSVTKEALQALYDANKDKEQGTYTDESWTAFQTALAEAKAMLDKEDATQTDVNEVLHALENAISNLETVKVEKAVLQTLYDMHKDKEQGSYTEETWNVFAEALEDAKAVLDNVDATQAEVDEAVATLNAAVEGLRSETTTVIKTQLNKALKDYADLLKQGASYTSESFTAFKQAYEKAQDVNDNATATQAEVDQAYTELVAARNALALVPNEPDTPDTPDTPNEPDTPDTPTTGDLVSNGVTVVGKDGTTLENTELVVNVLSNEQVEEILKKADASEFFSKVRLEDIFDISLLKDNVTVQPNGIITVKIKLTQEQIASGRNFNIVYIDDKGNMVDMDATRDGEYVAFDTVHLSNYALVSYEGEMPTVPVKSPSPVIKDSSAEASTANNMMLFILAGAVIIFFSKKIEDVLDEKK